MGHTGVASCIDISPDGGKLFTGGFDKTVRCWDIRQNKQSSLINFDSKVFSLGCSPNGNWIAAGLDCLKFKN